VISRWRVGQFGSSPWRGDFIVMLSFAGGAFLLSALIRTCWDRRTARLDHIVHHLGLALAAGPRRVSPAG
jgi:hypothetical protein